jgi:hypothetical protein
MMYIPSLLVSRNLHSLPTLRTFHLPLEIIHVYYPPGVH